MHLLSQQFPELQHTAALHNACLVHPHLLTVVTALTDWLERRKNSKILKYL